MKKCNSKIAIWMILAMSSLGATDYNIKYGGPLDSVKAYVYEDAVLTDSLVFDTATSYFDTTISLDETKAIMLQLGYFYTGYSYGLWGWEHVDFSISSVDVADYKADVSALALQAEVANIDGWNPATDSVNVDGSAFALIEWAQHMYVFLGWGEISSLPIWSQDRPNADVDTLFVGFHLSGGPPDIDTIAVQMIWHIGGAADDAPDSTTSVLW